MNKEEVEVQKDDRLILQLHSGEVYEGHVQNLWKTSIELYNVYSHSNNIHIETVYTFYRNEILQASKIVEEENQNDSKSNPTVNVPITASQPDNTLKVSTIKLYPGEYDRLKEMSFDFTYVEMFDKNYHEAIDLFTNSESVAVAGLGSTFDRTRSLSLLVMSDFKQVYIFDFMSLLSLKQLTDILESVYISKVVHNGAALFDCLYHKHGVEMKNVFDTQVYDTKLFCSGNSQNKTRNLAECLNFHLNFPMSVLADAMENVQDKFWVERPLSKSKRVIAAQYVTYLLTLRDYLRSFAMKGLENKIANLYKTKHQR